MLPITPPPIPRPIDPTPIPTLTPFNEGGIPISFGETPSGTLPVNALKPPWRLSGVGKLNSLPFAPPFPFWFCPGMNHPPVCRLKGLTGPRPPAPDPDPGITSGWVCRCNGGGLTELTLLRFARVRRVGPPFVLGGCTDEGVGGARERERDREREEVGLAVVALTGEGV